MQPNKTESNSCMHAKVLEECFIFVIVKQKWENSTITHFNSNLIWLNRKYKKPDWSNLEAGVVLNSQIIKLTTVHNF